MTKKANLSWRIGMIMLVLCATLIVTVLPAAADYTADNPLVTYKQGTISDGDMNYTIGDSYYSSKMWSNDTGNLYTVNLPETVPDFTNVVEARLYVYWTWSYDASVPEGICPVMDVTLNGNPLTLDERYTDRSGQATYNYPSGTDCYNVTLNLSNGGPYVVNISNTNPDPYCSFNIQGVGLLTVYENIFSSSNSVKDYWIDEGCDMTYVKWDTATNTWKYGVTPDDAVTFANFTGVNACNVTSANLITVVPAGDSEYNRLYFNYFFNYWTGLWDANPYSDLSWTTTDVENNLKCGTNYAGFQNGLYTMLPSNSERQMQAANAFLLVARTN